jgi:hypothetical protein
MSSAFRAPSQIRPNAFYRGGGSTTQLLDAAGANPFTVNVANVILADMGKTVYMGNAILRKVKVVGLSDNVVGYIYLSKAGGVTANIAAL